MKYVYLAGAMASEASRGAVAPWRVRMEKALSVAPLSVECLHPELAGCDHTGIWPEETVKADFAQIRRADALFAVLDDRLRVGTFTEIGYAYGLGTPVVGMVAAKAHLGGIVPRHNAHGGDHDFYRDVMKSGHSCTCMTEDGLAGYFWFPMASMTSYRIYDDDEAIYSEGVNLLVRTLMGIRDTRSRG